MQDVSVIVPRKEECAGNALGCIVLVVLRLWHHPEATKNDHLVTHCHSSMLVPLHTTI